MSLFPKTIGQGGVQESFYHFLFSYCGKSKSNLHLLKSFQIQQDQKANVSGTIGPKMLVKT